MRPLSVGLNGHPSGDALLDIDWLTRTDVAEGACALIQCIRRGAETYVRRFRPQAPDGRHHIDLAAVLAGGFAIS